jgi:eukaryotic-like serine/threonine-protein kinase
VIHPAEDRDTSPPAPTLPVVAGQVIGDRYRIGSIIGEGGMGVVCSATHIALGTPVAVKLIRADLATGPDSVLRFLNEARTAASLKGEHVARVYDVGQLDSGEPYLVMEQLDGIGLDAFIKEREPLRPSDAVDIVLQACEGLAEAHAVSLVHRDIKPANLFLARRPDGLFVVKILDFGISKRLLETARRGLTDPGSSLGSPWYMSPEQMKDSSMVDQRADVWSLGVLLFELLTKEWPFSGESVPQVCASVLTATPPVPSSLRAGIDAGLDAVVLRCLEKDPDQRYAGVAALADDLRPFGSRSAQSSALALGETSAAQGGQNRKRPWESESLAPVFSRPRPSRSRWSSVTIAAGLVAAGVLLAVLGLPYARQQVRLPGWAELERLRSPWDPVLLPGPLEMPASHQGDSPAPLMLQTVTAPLSNGASPAVGFGNAVEEPGPTPGEIQTSTDRNETWQREQQRLQAPDDASPTEETKDAPHDEP